MSKTIDAGHVVPSSMGRKLLPVNATPAPLAVFLMAIAGNQK
jgi:hypothetical protein